MTGTVMTLQNVLSQIEKIIPHWYVLVYQIPIILCTIVLLKSLATQVVFWWRIDGWKTGKFFHKKEGFNLQTFNNYYGHFVQFPFDLSRVRSAHINSLSSTHVRYQQRHWHNCSVLEFPLPVTRGKWKCTQGKWKIPYSFPWVSWFS